MKKLILISFTAVLALVLTAFTLNPGNGAKEKSENLECQYGQCSKIKDDGYRCRNCAQQGSYYCWSHR